MALSLQSNQYLQFPSTAGVISSWVRTSQTGTSIEIISQHSQTDSGPGWGVVMNNGVIQMYAKSNPSTVLWNIDSGVSINDGLWHHLGINIYFEAGFNQQLWIDGSLVINQPFNGNFVSSSQGRIGRSNDPSWAGFVGEVAELGIWGGPSSSIYFIAEQFQALAKGIRPPSVSLIDIKAYIPLVKNAIDYIGRDGQPVLV